MNCKIYENGEVFLYRGEEFQLRLVERDSPALTLECGEFLLSASAKEPYQAFEVWYKRALYDDLHAVFPLWTKKIGVSPSAVCIKTVRTLWGSCSSRGSVTFCTRLALTPPELLEYVVVHELCHFRQMNHSPLFWANVAKWLPDYKKRRTLLKKNSQIYKWW